MRSLERIIRLGHSIADDFASSRCEDLAATVRGVLAMLEGSSGGAKVYHHGNLVAFDVDSSLNYLHGQASHIRAWPDGIPRAVSVEEWQSKLEELVLAIEQYREGVRSDGRAR